MDTEWQEKAPETHEQRAPRRLHVFWYVAIVLALVGNVYLLFSTNRIAGSVAQTRESLSLQVATLNQQLTSSLEESRQHATTVAEDARQSALQAAERASQETRKSAAKVAARLAQQEQEQQQDQRQVAGALSDLKQATSTADSKIAEVSGDVTHVKADVALTQAELEKTGSELKRALGDMGVMSGLIATNSKEVGELRQLGERNYFEFDIKKTSGAKKVADISLEVRKTDPKRNKFTINLLADDKTVEKKDRSINEPVQFYLAGNRQPYELVINQVKKDEVIGYLATPRTKIARR
jgi:multidrug efflux pump subunit AcrA (membrane-fusion protein)